MKFKDQLLDDCVDGIKSAKINRPADHETTEVLESAIDGVSTNDEAFLVELNVSKNTYNIMNNLINTKSTIVMRPTVRDETKNQMQPNTRHASNFSTTPNKTICGEQNDSTAIGLDKKCFNTSLNNRAEGPIDMPASTLQSNCQV